MLCTLLPKNTAAMAINSRLSLLFKRDTENKITFLCYSQSTNTVVRGIALALAFDKPGIVCGAVIVYHLNANTK
jgi:hypothetical protein